MFARESEYEVGCGSRVSTSTTWIPPIRRSSRAGHVAEDARGRNAVIRPRRAARAVRRDGLQCGPMMQPDRGCYCVQATVTDSASQRVTRGPMKSVTF